MNNQKKAELPPNPGAPTKNACSNGTKRRKIVKRIVLTSVIVIIWGLLSIPVILYYLPLPQVNGDKNESYIMNDTFLAPELFSCRDDFFRDPQLNNICVPTCPSWKQDPTTLSVLYDVVTFIFYSVGFVASIIFLIISVLRRKLMFLFPNILVVYMTIVLLIQNIFYIVTYFDRSKLYCSSRSLYESLAHVTPFCVLTGMVQVYVSVSNAIWWFMLVVALFWKIHFPLHSRSFEVSKKKKKYLHIGCGLAGLLFPLVPVIALMVGFAVKVKSSGGSFISGGLGFTHVRFPPIPCNGNDKAIIFYTVIFPIDLLLVVGITLTVLILWIVHKKFGLVKDRKSKNIIFKIGSSERKLLIILCYYITAAVIGLSSYSDFSRKSGLFEEKLNEYFKCEQLGHDPSNPCDRTTFETLSSTRIAIVTSVIVGIQPAVNLLFAVNVEEIKHKCFLCLAAPKTSKKDDKNAVSTTPL